MKEWPYDSPMTGDSLAVRLPAGKRARRRAARSLALALLLFSPICFSPSFALADRSLPQPGDPAWTPLVFPNIETHTQFEVVEDPEGRPAFRAVSECGASAMRIPLPANLSAAETPRLAWRWRIEEGLDVPDEKTKPGDDFAARVYVLFPFEPDRAGAFERIQRRLGKALFGVSMPGKSLNYVFSSREAPGSVWTSPYHDDARLIAVDSAGSAAGPDDGESDSPGEWSEIVVDWPADAKRLFDSVPAVAPYALAIMVDADSVCGRAVAWFSDFRLLGP